MAHPRLYHKGFLATERFERTHFQVLKSASLLYPYVSTRSAPGRGSYPTDRSDVPTIPFPNSEIVTIEIWCWPISFQRIRPPGPGTSRTWAGSFLENTAFVKKSTTLGEVRPAGAPWRPPEVSCLNVLKRNSCEKNCISSTWYSNTFTNDKRISPGDPVHVRITRRLSRLSISKKRWGLKRWNEKCN